MSVVKISQLLPKVEFCFLLRQEYELGKLPIDVINGSPLLREWVDDDAAMPRDLEAMTAPEEEAWDQERAQFLKY